MCGCDAVQMNCTMNRRRCPGNGRCIPATYFCDGDNDCGDRSDESSAICRQYLSLIPDLKAMVLKTMHLLN